MKLFEFLGWVYYDFRNPHPRVPEEFIIFVGKKGSGKSVSLQYHQSIVRDFYDVPVYLFANYKSKLCSSNILLTANDIMATPPNSVIYIDEAAEKFDARKWKSLPEIMSKLVTQNRHLNKTVVMAAQDFIEIDSKFRRKMDYVIEVSNFAHRWIFWSAFERKHYLAIAKLNEEGQKMYDARGDEVIDRYRGNKLAWRDSFIATNELYASYDDKELAFGL